MTRSDVSQSDALTTVIWIAKFPRVGGAATALWRPPVMVAGWSARAAIPLISVARSRPAQVASTSLSPIVRYAAGRSPRRGLHSQYGSGRARRRQDR
jgi:hypothetical protein